MAFSINVIKQVCPLTSLQEVKVLMDGLPDYPLAYSLWSCDPPPAVASFKLALINSALVVEFKVEEHFFKAEFIQPNAPVYRDSCVELFIAFADDPAYYNLEFNPIGTVLGEYGSSKLTRLSLHEDKLRLIKSEAEIQTRLAGFKFSWKLTVVVPSAVFHYHDFTFFGGMGCRFNIFKCGDDLQRPHYLAFNPIRSVKPDFHQPNSFIQAKFEDNA